MQLFLVMVSNIYWMQNVWIDWILACVLGILSKVRLMFKASQAGYSSVLNHELWKIWFILPKLNIVSMTENIAVVDNAPVLFLILLMASGLGELVEQLNLWMFEMLQHKSSRVLWEGMSVIKSMYCSIFSCAVKLHDSYVKSSGWVSCCMKEAQKLFIYFSAILHNWGSSESQGHTHINEKKGKVA